MPRTPKPSTTRLVTLRLEMHNYEWLSTSAAATGLPLSNVLNQAIQFAYTAGLQPLLVRGLNEHLKKEHRTFREFFTSVVLEAAMSLPAGRSSSAKTSPELDRTRHVSSANIEGANDAYLMKVCLDTGKELNPVINTELEFVQTLGLRPELQHRVVTAAQDLDSTMQDWATLQMLQRVVPLLQHVDLTPLKGRKPKERA